MVFSYGSPRKLKQPWFTQAILDAGVYVRVPKSQKREKEEGREKQGWLKKKKKKHRKQYNPEDSQRWAFKKRAV